MRDPIDEYAIIKEIEDKVLNFNEMLKAEAKAAKIAAAGGIEEPLEEGQEEEEFKSSVKTYVVSAGILYGKGEAMFDSHLK